MKIIKHGKNYPEKKKEQFEEFKCNNCGCEFKVKEDEYYTDERNNYSNISLTYHCYMYKTLVCSCPECHKICKKDVEKNNYYTSLTGTDSNSVTIDASKACCAETK